MSTVLASSQEKTYACFFHLVTHHHFNQYLSEIQTSMDMTSAEYEYPLSLDNTPPPCPSRPHQTMKTSLVAASQSSLAPIYENVASSNGQLPPIADNSDIDSDYSEVEQALIQVYLYVVLYNFVCIYMYGCFTSVMYLIS